MNDSPVQFWQHSKDPSIDQSLVILLQSLPGVSFDQSILVTSDPNSKIQAHRFNMIWIWMMHMTCDQRHKTRAHDINIYNINIEHYKPGVVKTHL